VAEKDDARQRVRERIRDEQGHQWTDLSAWLWQAGAGSLEGPWWSEIWIEPERATGARASPRVR
jgi:hypothetical protein